MNRRVSTMNLKLVFFVAGVVLALMICIVAVSKVSASEHGKREKYVKTVTIESGDTLWDIASKNCCDEYESVDEYIEDIMKINNMSSTKIITGYNLLIPYYE